MSVTISKRRLGDRTDRVGGSQRDQRAPLRHFAFLAFVLLLMLVGVVLVLSASTVTAIDQTGQSFFYFNRHLLFVALGVTTLLVLQRIDYHHLRRLVLPLVGASAAGLLTVLLVAERVNGSRRWIRVGGFTVQPSEFAKLALVVAVAVFLDSRRNQLHKSHRILRPLGLALAALCALMMAQPDLGTTLILLFITIGMLFAAGIPGRDVAKVTGIVGTLGLLGGLAASYRRERLLGFLNPIDERQDAGWQTFQSLVGLANGGLRGVGLGAGRSKWGWLPNAHTDFIFAILGEELGLAGALLTLLLLAGIGVLGFRISQMAPDFFGALLAAGITVWFMAQAFVNIGGVVGLLPITGVTLPFVSFGGSSLLVNSAAAGVLLNVARQSK